MKEGMQGNERRSRAVRMPCFIQGICSAISRQATIGGISIFWLVLIRCFSHQHILHYGNSVYTYNPIQLLRPPGLCSAVCPIFTRLQLSSLSCLRLILGGSTASIRGLINGADDDEWGVNIPPSNAAAAGGEDLSLCRSGAPFTDKNDSACHSYQICFSLVILHIDTSSSQLLGKYNGS